MSYMDTYKKWCTDSYFDEETRKELLALQGNDAEIEDRFYRQLEFGTGGLRGVIGAGTNRMNIYTVRQATQGLATISFRRTDRTRELRSLMIPVSCPRSFPMRQRSA